MRKVAAIAQVALVQVALVIVVMSFHTRNFESDV